MAHNGLLLLDKVQGITSRAAVDCAAACFKQRKIGHAGTLDPLATGLLVLCLGNATRLVPYIQEQKKVYEATITLGARSDTDDAGGKLKITPGCPLPTAKEVAIALESFVGTNLQVPPQYSAAKVAGRRAYSLARHGKTIKLAPRTVTISKIKLLEYQFPTLQITVTVSKGTYIRALARDLGEKLNTGAFLSDLRRTKIGDFKVEDAISCDDLELQPADTLPSLLLPNLKAVSHLQQLVIGEADAKKIKHGQSITAPKKMGPGPIALVFSSELLAISKYQADDKTFRPILVLGQ